MAREEGDVGCGLLLARRKLLMEKSKAAPLARETERLRAEVEGTLAGDPWYGSSVLSILDGVDAAAAAAKPVAGAHSIWELVLHITAWTREVARRLRGKSASPPAEGDWPPVPATDSKAWSAAVADLRDAHADLARAVAETDDAFLGRQVGGDQVDSFGKPITLHRTVIGALQHIAYHAGQISLLKRTRASKLGRSA